MFKAHLSLKPGFMYSHPSSYQLEIFLFFQNKDYLGAATVDPSIDYITSVDAP